MTPARIAVAGGLGALLAGALAGNIHAAPAAGTAPKPGAGPTAVRIAAPVGVATATEYAHGAPIRTTLETTVTISPLRLRLTGLPSYPVRGDRVTITLSVSNGGAAPVTGLRAILELTAGTMFVSAPVGPVPAGPLPLAPGGVAAFTWTLSVSAEGEVFGRARVTATVTGQGPVSGDITAVIAPPGVARLRAWLSPNPVSIRTGQWFDLEVTVSNTGGVRAAGVRPDVAAIGGGALIVPVPGADMPEPAILEPGESTTFRFSYSANGSGQVMFGVTLTGESDLSPPGLASRSAVAIGEGTRTAMQHTKAAAARAASALRTWLNPPRPPAPAETPLTSFESPADLKWTTEGYVALAASATRVTDGDRSCEATFLLPTDLTMTPTGAFRPGMRLTAPARGGGAALLPRDWSGFLALRLDAYGQSERPLAVTLTLTDRRGWQYSAVRQLVPASATTLTFDLAPARDARVELAGLTGLELAVDTTGLKTRPVIWFDRMRFALPPPVVTSTVMAVPTLSRTAGGRPLPAAQGAK